MVGDCDWHFVYSEDTMSFGHSMGCPIKLQKPHTGAKDVTAKLVCGGSVNCSCDFVILQSNLSTTIVQVFLIKVRQTYSLRVNSFK